MYTILKQLATYTAVSGGEQTLLCKVKALLEPFTDEMHTDALGNLIAVRRGNGANPKKLMLSAHTDEAGLIVTYIEENGLIRFGKIGDINLSAGAFTLVQSERGVRGVLTADAHAEPDYTPDKMYIDIGAKDRRAAARRVQIGDRFALHPSLIRLGNKKICGTLLGKIESALLIDIARKLTAPKDDVYFVFTAQSEAGHRGAKSAAFTVSPDLALVFDLTPANADASPRLGDGAALLYKSASGLCDLRLAKRLLALAKQEEIAVQPVAISERSTDISAIQTVYAGCAAAALTIPTANMHTACEIADLNDVKACAALALKLIQEGIEYGNRTF